MPGQQKRKKSVRQKLNAMSAEFKNKNVLIVDDSIVRGTTSKEIVQMAKDAGANKFFLHQQHLLFVFLTFTELICLIETN
jgi:amidophosphoribosyltransferase